MTRNPALDLIRGSLLLLMTMAHLPTIWAGRFGHPVGFISAAEGFVFLSAFLAARVFLKHQQRTGFRAASRWVFNRALTLYFIHMALLVVAFTVVAWIAVRYQRPAVLNLLDLYLQSPRKAILSSIVLVYQPPLLDILPMYVVFLAGTALVMRATRNGRWHGVLAASLLVWVAAQLGLRSAVHAAAGKLTGVDIPLQATGAFDLFAWQFLWILGLWFGALGCDKTRRMLVSSRGVLQLALALCCLLMFWRYYSGPGGFADPVRHQLWIDKWSLSPVRLLNLGAVVFVLVGYGSHLVGQLPLRLPRIEALGGASQWVFVAHIASALLLLCLVGQDDQPLQGMMGGFVMACGFLALFAAGMAYHGMRRRRSQP